MLLNTQNTFLWATTNIVQVSRLIYLL